MLGIRLATPDSLIKVRLAHYLMEKPFNTFKNREDPDQAALVTAA